MSVDVAALEEVYAFIRDNPSRWDQGWWANECGTSHCFAGWTCVMTGEEIDYSRGTGNIYSLVDGESIGEAAARILGLDYYDAEALFRFNNQMSTIRKIINNIKRRIQSE